MSEKFPTNGTPAHQAENLRKWGCGGCSRAADAIEVYGERLAEAERLIKRLHRIERHPQYSLDADKWLAANAVSGHKD